MKNFLIYFALCLFIISCDKNDLKIDYRDDFTGTYHGIKKYTYGYFNPTDTSLWSGITDSIERNVLITKGVCDNCIAIIYDTIFHEGIVYLDSDTIEIPESGIYESEYGIKIGHQYFDSYDVSIIDDSLTISYGWSGITEKYRYGFKGKKINNETPTANIFNPGIFQ